MQSTISYIDVAYKQDSFHIEQVAILEEQTVVLYLTEGIQESFAGYRVLFSHRVPYEPICDIMANRTIVCWNSIRTLLPFIGKHWMPFHLIDLQQATEYESLRIAATSLNLRHLLASSLGRVVLMKQIHMSFDYSPIKKDIRDLCRLIEISPTKIKSKTRESAVVQYRDTVIHALYKMGHSKQAIADALDRHRTTVLYTLQEKKPRNIGSLLERLTNERTRKL